MKKDEYIGLLKKFYAGETNEKENAELAEWIKDESEEDLEEYFGRVWEKSPDRVDSVTMRRMKKEIAARIRTTADVSKAHKIPFAIRIARWAAAAAILFMVGFAGYKYGTMGRKSEMFSACTDKGERSEVLLPDSSIVWLNSDTKITYSSDYSKKERKIGLEGEAFFEVAKNKSCPFIVNAGAVSVEALGTKFNVKAYSEDDRITTTLINGKVKTRSKNKTVYLLPDERISYSKTDGGFDSKENLGKGYRLPWRNDEILFDSSSLEDIAKILERNYGVNIAFKNEGIRKIKYTGLIMNTKLENVLDLITLTSNVDYDIINDTIFFNSKSKRKE
ncbi:MAG: FecR family protein [Bacteroidales bacterium]|jgi:ferric-dicitrate binding protein FerR (iron transport regulator)|nr:FecR family protein [Bacteroidales bacterium]MCI2145875.1 FecR family protein [Bacteroidales bacterium]